MAFSLRQNEYSMQRGLPDDQTAILWGSVVTQGGCWEWIGCRQGNGYGRIRINGKTLYAHRVSYLAFNADEIPAGMDICHRCDNRQCVNPEHLFLGSRKENMQDAKAKGRLSAGQQHASRVKPRTKLTDQQVQEIRAFHADGVTAKDLATAYGSDVSNIRLIVRRLTRKDVQ